MAEPYDKWAAVVLDRLGCDDRDVRRLVAGLMRVEYAAREHHYCGPRRTSEDDCGHDICEALRALDELEAT